MREKNRNRSPQKSNNNIYYLHALLTGPAPAWDGALDRCADMGFWQVLLPPLVAPGSGGNLFLAGDLDLPHPACGWHGDTAALIAHFAGLCRARGVLPLVDLVLDQVAADGALCRAHADLFEAVDGPVGLDPRIPRAGFGAVRALWEVSDAAAALIELWIARLRGWAAAGLGGVRLLGLGAVPGARLAALIAGVRQHAPDFRFLGWAPGVPRTRYAEWRGAGLDLVFCSLPWWNFRDGWLWDEIAALRDVAPLAAAPEAPCGRRLATQWQNPALLRAFYLRALRLAAALGAGWLLPMGFEYAAGRALPDADPRPDDFAAMRDDAPFDLTAEIAALNTSRSEIAGLDAGETRLLTGPGGDAIALLRGNAQEDAQEATALALLNARLEATNTLRCADLLPAAAVPLAGFLAEEGVLGPQDEISLAPAELRLLPALLADRVRLPAISGEKSALAAAAAPRIAIEAISPHIPDGEKCAVRRIVGETVMVSADLICDGHGELAAVLRWRAADAQPWQEVPMRPLGNDRWAAEFPLARLGRHEFMIEAWCAAFATFRAELEKKHGAGLDLSLELAEGRDLIAAAAARCKGGLAASLQAVLERLERAEVAERSYQILIAEATADLMRCADDRPFSVRSSPPLPLDAERASAGFASWYELFPRSMSDDPERHGTFDDVIRHLPRIRAMGFDVLYLPPIHPIGKTNRKGRNNAAVAAPGDPGSPYAIGDETGGHEAIHPALGTLEDFRRLRDAAAASGLEMALDFAIQCSPDHPWLRAHRDWFAWRPDGSLRYAENPPKKYEDIVNVDFYAAGAIPALWLALRDIVRFWLSEGVRLFRVDNPHTKPLPFWEWLIAEIHCQDPGVVFLAEAFTRPKMMYRLAKIGFSQSYTYFTWRNTKQELQAYFTELTTTSAREYFRPHLFVNTPDINPYFLQNGGRAGFLIRAALASTLSGLWGMYCGFELCEAAALPEREEYLDSEKYQIRAWDWERPGNIVAEIARLNQIRRDNPALRSHLGLAFHTATNDSVLFYRKASADGRNVLAVAVSLDPYNVQEADVEIPLWEWGLADDDAIGAENLMTGERTILHGKWQSLRLDPKGLPFLIWRLAPLS